MAGHVQLLLGNAFADTWREVARPWLAEAARKALTAPQPWVVLTPSRAWAQAVKARLVGEGQAIGGVYFWTPGEARDHLRRACGRAPHVAVREHLHLLLASTRSETAREPSRLMRSLDQLAAAGWDATHLDFKPAVDLARGFQRALQDAGWCTVQSLDWSLAHEPPPEAIDHLLLLGFDAAHWEIWPLLQAVVRSARQATAVLAAPRSKAEYLDQTWIGTWEQAFGAAEPLAAEDVPSPFGALARKMENPEADTGRSRVPPLDILIGRHVREQAEAIVAQCLAYLAAPEAARIGILFPGPGPLCREVSAQLLQRGVPHFNAFGHMAPPPAAALRWRAWTSLQRSYRLGPLLELLKTDGAPAQPARFERSIEEAFGELLVDDVEVLAARLEDMGRPEAIDAARFLRSFARLPSQGSIDALLAATRDAWQRLGWSDLPAMLEAQGSALGSIAQSEVPVAAWLEWLDAVAPGSATVREPDAANPLAVVHLLAYTQAEGLSWSHLILTDLNEGCWPPAIDPGGFLGDDRIAQLNREAVEQGSQGEGHVAVRRDRSLMLGPMERREILRRQFYNLVECAGVGLAVTCALEGDDASGRLRPASDFLSHLHFTAVGLPLSEQRMESLHTETSRWLSGIPGAPPVEPPAQPCAPGEVARAYAARRAQAPFGPYECAFAAGAPPAPVRLSCKSWERAVRDPSGQWFKHYLRAEPAGDISLDDRWPLTRGVWVHRWLARGLCDAYGRLEQRAPSAAICDRVRRAAQDTHRVLARAFAAAKRAEPQWWRARLAHAEWMAVQFARRLSAVEDWPAAATEWRLPKDAHHATRHGRLDLRGIIDALLAEDAADAIPTDAWVIDFKTGQEKALTERTLATRLRDGFGVQICLYALALASVGARRVAVSLLTSESNVAPQVTLDAIRAQDVFWDELARMQNSGIFGMRGQVRAEYGPSLDLPLAALPVDPDLLEEKWELTHAALAGEADNEA